jgi:hypothetical protein
MPENPSEHKAAETFKYWRLFELALAAIYACSICTALVILRDSTWHPHLVRFLGRSWDIFVAQDVGSTSRGFLSAGIEAVVTIIVVAAMICYLHGFAEFRKHIAETAIIALFAIPTVAALVYGTQFAWEVAKAGYQDHESLILANQALHAQPQQIRNVLVPSNVPTLKGIANIDDLLERLSYSLSSTLVVVSAPPRSVNSQQAGNIIIALGREACNRHLATRRGIPDCSFGLATPYTNVNEELRLTSLPPKSGIVVHSLSSEIGQSVAKALGNLFSDVTWKNEMPKQIDKLSTPRGFGKYVWVEVGEQVKMHEYNCEPPGSPCTALLKGMLVTEK